MRSLTFSVAIALGAIGSLVSAPASAQKSDSLWTIRGGTYAGSVVRVDPSSAARKGRFWRFSNIRGTSRIVGWNPSRLPAPVAFRAKAAVSERDSAAFWNILQQMEQDAGMRLFEPVSLADGEDPQDVIVVEVKSMPADEGRTLVTWSSYGSLYDARVFLRSSSTLRDERVVTHEMMHALGFGHTTAWPSVMSPGMTMTRRLTREDVAYAQMAVASRAANESDDLWERLALAASREPGIPLEDGHCEFFYAVVRSPATCTFFPCFAPAASCRAARNTESSPGH